MTSRKARRITTRFLLLLTAVLACIFSVLPRLRQIERQGTQFELITTKIRVGSLADDAEQILDGPPQSTSQVFGVFKSPKTFLSDTNPKSKTFGRSKRYEIREWQRDRVSVSVFVDRTDRVAGVFTKKRPWPSVIQILLAM